MNAEEFYLEFSEFLPKDKLVYSLDEWDGDIPWVVMLSSLGKVMAKEMGSIPGGVKDRLFELIRIAMNGGDELLSTAVATGLLEGLYTAAENDVGIIDELKINLDGASIKYLKGWLAWSGGEW